MAFTPRTPWAHRIRRGGDDDINLRPASAPPKGQLLDRYRLSAQYKRGPHLEPDDVEDNSFSLSKFSMGTTRRVNRGQKFLAGFTSDADGEHSRVSFNFSRRWIYIYAIPMTFNDTPPCFLPLEVEVPFEDIVTSGIRVDRMKERVGELYRILLTVTTRRPGRFYINVKNQDLIRRATARDFVFSPSSKESTSGRSVQVMMAEGCIIHEGHAGPMPAISDESFAVPVQAWMSWRLDLLLDAEGVKRFVRKIKDLNICGREDGQDLLGPSIGKLKHLPTSNMPHVQTIPVLSKRSFQIRYLVEGLVSHGLVVPSEIPELLKELDMFCKADEDLKARVLTALFNEERIYNLRSIIIVRARQLRGRPLDSDDSLVWIYRCTVTPTRICMYPPEKSTSNEAIRQHNTFRDRFLRVTFADESDRIQVNPTVIAADETVPYQGTFARVRRALQNGLEIAGRHYVFLAYSASSAREHSCWFVAEDRSKDFTAEKVGIKLGYGGIKDTNVAKYAARMGIPFSSTRPVNVQLNVRTPLPDLYAKTPQGKICFTDGVGQCGRRVARQAAKAFGDEEGYDASPSAIQIRCGGIKGVLGVWPTLCDDDDVRFRPTQIKFETDAKTMQFGLSVVRTAQFRRATLNRQFIIIMNYLGVKISVFEELFLEAIIKTRDIPKRMKNGRPSAHDLLLAKIGMPNFKLLTMLGAGMNRDPFFVDIVKVLETHQLHGLKWKNRLELKNGVCLMGIADELGLLREGEVFCQYWNPNDPEEGAKVVTGECTIMRAPSVHPGDVRTVEAVDIPELRHLCNVIVFSVHGTPLPDMLSGGDLDGDDYTLLWDKRLLPRRVVPAANYFAPTPFLVKKQVQRKHVLEFFINYIKNDILGQVSNAHLAHADRHPDGPGAPICLELARQASLAVDFPKSGVPARLSPQMRPRQWPTFMGKEQFHNNNYPSKRVLGVLFDLVHPDPEFIPTDFRQLPADEKFDSRISKFKLPAPMLDDAFKLKQNYDTTVLGLMTRYRITEAEVVAGIILRKPKRRGGRDGDMKETVEQNYRALRAVVLEHARAFVETKQLSTQITKLQIYAIAAYQVTYVDEIREAVEKRLGIKGVLEELLDDSLEEEMGVKGEKGEKKVKDGEVVNGDKSNAPNGAKANGNTANETNGAKTEAANGDSTKEIKGKDEDEKAHDEAQRASDAYVGKFMGPAPLISFPWVFMKELCDLPNVRGAGPVVTEPIKTLKKAKKDDVDDDDRWGPEPEKNGDDGWGSESECNGWDVPTPHPSVNGYLSGHAAAPKRNGYKSTPKRDSAIPRMGLPTSIATPYQNGHAAAPRENGHVARRFGQSNGHVSIPATSNGHPATPPTNGNGHTATSNPPSSYRRAGPLPTQANAFAAALMEAASSSVEHAFESMDLNDAPSKGLGPTPSQIGKKPKFQSRNSDVGKEQSIGWGKTHVKRASDDSAYGGW